MFRGLSGPGACLTYKLELLSQAGPYTAPPSFTVSSEPVTPFYEAPVSLSKVCDSSYFRGLL